MIDVVNEYYRLATTVRKPSGYILVDGVEIAQTLQCPHCDKHFLSRKGSGIRRSFCTNCMKVTCGAPLCISECTPFLRKLDEYETGKRRSL